ncbi:hypothetical protein [Flavobacterium limi]|uniref:hypothetical protein n=1 Tax=Flavobacterium limi TaxID=2045105 RepID=UPI0013CFB920|nr:hypothetical protein [Flavobacterium limi]
MRKIFLLLLFILGFLLMPNNAMSCNKSLKTDSHKEMSSMKVKEHSCCKSSYSKNKKHNCDGGKCTHTKCGCSSSCSVFLSFTEVNTSDFTIEIAFTIQKFPNFQTLVSTGYGSLWLIPKIG